MNLERDIAGRQIGGLDETFELSRSEDSKLAIASLVAQARRSIFIISRDLDPRVYDDADIVSSIKEFVLSSRRSKVRIVVRDIARIVRRGHRLVDLQKRLPSYIAIRTPAKEHMNYNNAFVIVDNTALLYRNYADRYEGQLNVNAAAHVEELGNLFSDMWEHASVPADLRSLVI